MDLFSVTSPDITVAKNPTVALLKQAVDDAFSHLPKHRSGKVSWSHVWAQFCLCFEGQKLLNDHDSIGFHGIKDGDQVTIHVWAQFCLCFEGQKLLNDQDSIGFHGIKDGDQILLAQDDVSTAGDTHDVDGDNPTISTLRKMLSEILVDNVTLRRQVSIWLRFFKVAATAAFCRRRRLLPFTDAAALHRCFLTDPRDAGRQGLVSSWIRVDVATRDSQVIEVDEFDMMRHCHLRASDLRLLLIDPLYTSIIFCRERATVVNLEQIRCIITSDEVVLPNSGDSHVSQYVVELQRRLKDDCSHFEIKALQAALQVACNILGTQAEELEKEARLLKSKISTPNLECVHKLRSKLVALTERVEKVRDEIHHQLIARSRQVSTTSSDSATYELEIMSLASNLDVVVNTLNKLRLLKESIDHAERFINFQLVHARNRFVLLLTIAFVVSIFGVVAVIFGMSFEVWFNYPSALCWVLVIIGVCGAFSSGSFWWFLKRRGLMQSYGEMKV